MSMAYSKNDLKFIQIQQPSTQFTKVYICKTKYISKTIHDLLEGLMGIFKGQNLNDRLFDIMV